MAGGKSPPTKRKEKKTGQKGRGRLPFKVLAEKSLEQSHVGSGKGVRRESNDHGRH